MAQTPKVTVVLGATGSQGSSVVRHLSTRPDLYTVYGTTRNTGSSKAQQLAQAGVQLRSADLDDPVSLKRALNDAQVIYAMTDFWQSLSATVEEKQGNDLMDIAASLPNLEHLVWASLPDGAAISGGKYPNILHWQSKAAVTKYIQTKHPALWEKTTEVLFPNYFENCVTQPGRYLPVKQENGDYVRSFVLSPSALLPNVSIEDTGKLVLHILENAKKYQKKTIAFYAEALSESEKAQRIAELYNITVRYNKLTPEEFKGNLEKDMTPLNALDFAEQLMIFDDFGNLYSRPEFIQAHQIPGLQLTTWKEFIASHDLKSLMDG